MRTKPIVAMSAPATIMAAEADDKGPRKFTAEFYTGGKLEVNGYDLPVVVDLAGLSVGKVLVANLDHDPHKRVGNFAVANDGKSLVANGTASAATPARDEVVNSADGGYQWQASLEVTPKQIETVKAGKSVTVNGQEHLGPLYVTRTGVLKGFAFVSHGADDNTTATIAASAAHTGVKKMDAKLKAWIEAMGFDVDTLSAEQITGLEANYNGQAAKKPAVTAASSPFEARKIEAKRVKDIREVADLWAAKRENDLEWIAAIEKMCDHAIEAKMGVQEFRNELYESTVPLAHTVSQPRTRDAGLNNRVLQAALCETGRLSNIDKHFNDQELQAAHDRFPHGISLGQLYQVCAQANGFSGLTGGAVTLDMQRAAFRQNGRQINAAGGYSTVDIATIVSATANKFMMDGWNAIDQTCLRIANIRSVKNFQQITTVSLTDSLRFEQIGADGEIKHGTLDEITYTNQADTYARMLAITRKDIINDDTGALTAAPRKLGLGAMKLLNHIFWTEFLALVGASFFASGNSNINTGVADMTVGGLDATETIFMNQTNPDGTPLGVSPAIILVPTALRNKAAQLMGSQGVAYDTSAYATAGGNANPFFGRYRVESSPYISNSSYTGYTSTAWWMLANPAELAVIEIVALNGRVTPTVDTADADFNTLGIQMRGYSDVGVKRQEYRAGVHADGGSS